MGVNSRGGGALANEIACLCETNTQTGRGHGKPNSSIIGDRDIERSRRNVNGCCYNGAKAWETHNLLRLHSFGGLIANDTISPFLYYFLLLLLHIENLYL
uniref:Uncharacterized protein n=1 Tax=Cacopsylla melanoneura TaxID=428564 RepID=A0A8D8ZPF0_9HEMI